MKAKQYRLKKDIVIKAGEIFECIDGRKSEYVSGNISTLVGLSKDTCGEFIYGIDMSTDEVKEQMDEWFVVVNDELDEAMFQELASLYKEGED